MAELNKFRCPNGHSFETKRIFRAFCPTCGKSARRIFEGDPPPSNDGTNDDEAGKTNDKNNNGGRPESDDKKEENKAERKFRARRVIVKNDGKKTPTKRTPPKSKQPPAKVDKKTIVSRRRVEAGPKVTKRVITNKDKANDAKSKNEYATPWQHIKKISGF